MDALIYVTTVFLFWLVLQAIYVHMVRPVLLFSAKCRLATLNAELRARVKTGAVQEDDAYRILTESLSSHRAMWQMSFSFLMWNAWRRTPSLEARREREVLEASDALRDLVHELDAIHVALIVTNSPFWWLPMPLFFALVVVSRKAKTFRERIVILSSEPVASSGCRVDQGRPLAA